jgi:hypothetical protein
VTETGTETEAEAGAEMVGQGFGSPGPDGLRDGLVARGWRERYIRSEHLTIISTNIEFSIRIFAP